MSNKFEFDWDFFWEHLLQPDRPFIDGFVRTIYISIIAMLLAMLVGLVVALMNGSRFRLLRALSALYVWVVRGTPLLVQLVIIYLGLAASGIYTFSDVTVAGITVAGVIQAAILTLVIHEGAYISEIVRAGIQGVDKGQMEAGLALGLTRGRTMGGIILPQSLRFMVPPLGNTFNGLMKATSILSIIGVSDVFLVTQAISASTFRTFEIFLVAAAYYLALTTVWAYVQSRIERRLDAKVGITRPHRSWWTRRRITPVGSRPLTPDNPAVVPHES